MTRRGWLGAVLAAVTVLAPLALVSRGPLAPRADSAPPARADEAPRAAAAFGDRPVGFEANYGQVEAGVRFVARAGSVILALGEDRATITAPAAAGTAGEAVHLRLVGAKAGPDTVGLDRLPGVTNYLDGPDPSSWHTGIPSYARVAYRSVYPGIDLVHHAEGGRLEYDFVVAPGADPARIGVRFDGAARISVEKGELVVATPGGAELRQRPPVIYQEVAGRRRPVAGGYRLEAEGTVAFRLGPYDESRPLVIDPVLAWSTYMGDEGTAANIYGDGTGSGLNRGPQVAIDGQGNAYLAGKTNGSFPTQNAFQPLPAGAFVAKFTRTGTLVYSTYLSRGAIAQDVAADIEGNAYVVGATTEVTYATTPSAYRPVDPWISAGGSQNDGHPVNFLTKLDPLGRPAYSTYLWPSKTVRPLEYSPIGLAVEAPSAVWVTGLDYRRSEDDLRVKVNPYRAPCAPDQEVGEEQFRSFVTVLDTLAIGEASHLASTCGIGGRDIALGEGGAAYTVGDGVGAEGLAKVTRSRTALGRTVLDVPLSRPEPSGFAVTVGGAAVSVVGRPDFSSGQPEQSVSRVDASLEGPIHRYPDHGGVVLGIAVGPDGGLYEVGYGAEGHIRPTADAYQRDFGGGPSDAIIVRFDSTGTRIVYSTYLGGPNLENTQAGYWESFSGDRGSGIAVSLVGDIYLSGVTDSDDFPTTEGAFQRRRGAPKEAAHLADVFAARFTDAVPLISDILPKEGFVCEATPVTITGRGFPDDPRVTFAGKAATLTGGGVDTIDVVTPLAGAAGEATAAGPAEVRVTSAAGNSSSTSLLGSFRYLVPPPPVLAGLDRRSGSPLGGDRVTISALGRFACVSGVRFGEAQASDVKVSADGTTVSVTSPAHDPGPVRVQVVTATTAGGSRPATPDAEVFTFAPLLRELVPSSGYTTGGTAVEIRGKGFTPDSTVRFGETVAAATVHSAEKIMAMSPVQNLPRTVPVTVSTAGGLVSVPLTAAANLFSYLSPPPPPADPDPDPGEGGPLRNGSQPTAAPPGGTSPGPSATANPGANPSLNPTANPGLNPTANPATGPSANPVASAHGAPAPSGQGAGAPGASGGGASSAAPAQAPAVAAQGVATAAPGGAPPAAAPAQAGPGGAAREAEDQARGTTRHAMVARRHDAPGLRLAAGAAGVIALGCVLVLGGVPGRRAGRGRGRVRPGGAY